MGIRTWFGHKHHFRPKINTLACLRKKERLTGEKVRWIRDNIDHPDGSRRGVTASVFARILGMRVCTSSRVLICYWEKGKHPPPRRLYNKLLDLYIVLKARERREQRGEEIACMFE